MSLAPLGRAFRLATFAGLLSFAPQAVQAQICSGSPVTFTVSGSFTPPAGSDYTLTLSARGADGARPTDYPSNGGRGAVIVSRFVVPGGTTFQVLTGTAGAAGTVSAGGGGGTAVATGSTLLTVAGGGGGGGQGNAPGEGGRAALGGTPAGGAQGAGPAGGGGGGGGFGAAGAGTAGSGGGAGATNAGGQGGTGGGSVIVTAPGAGGNGGSGVGAGGGGVNGGGGGGGYLGGDGGLSNLTSFGGGSGGTSYVNTGVFSGEVLSATDGATGDVASETPGDPFGKKDGEVTVTCEVVVPDAADPTFPGTDGLGNDTGWRLLGPTAETATLADLADDLDLTLDAPGGLGRVLRWTGRTWVAVADADEIGGGQAVAVYLPDSADEPLTSAGITVDYAAAAPTAAASAGPLDDQTAFALVGNPFAQTFDLSTLDAEGFRDAVFVWDAETMSYESRSRTLGDALAPAEAGFLRRDRIGRGATSVTLPVPAAAARRAQTEVGRVRLAVTALDADGAVLGQAQVAVLLTPDASSGSDAFDTPAPGPLAAAFALAAVGDDALGQEGLPTGDVATRLRVGAVRLGAARYEIRLLDADGSVPVGTVVATFGGQTVDLAQGRVLQIPASAVTEGTSMETGLAGAAEIPLTLSSASTAADGPLSAATLALAAAPNPVRGLARLTWSADGPAQVAVYDALGRQVAVVADASMQSAATFDTSGLPAGVYVVRLRTSAGVAVQRLTVVR
ncbi:MAG: hypothetical protein CMM85_13830 [Rhodothermaceae bacterium]|nr:hypothetical protein [Rhodothermaceae bacterium]